MVNPCLDDDCSDAWTKSPVYVVHFSTCLSPVASAITGSATVCENAAGLTYSVTNLTDVSYSWTVPEGWIITAGQGTHSITVAVGVDSGDIKVTPSSECGGTGATQTKAVTVILLPDQPTVEGSWSVCPNVPLTYTVANDAEGVAYSWQVPTGWQITAGQGTKTITATAAAGDWSFIYVTPSDNGCAGATGSLAVFSNPSSSVPQPSAITGSTSVCTGVSNLTYSVGNTEGISYTWTVPSGWSIANGQGSSSITAKVGTTTGSFNLSVAPVNGCGIAGTPQTLTVTVRTIPDQPAPVTGGTAACANQTNISYSVTSVSGVSYTWTKPASWTITAGQNTNSITLTAGSGGGTVSVTPASSYGCGNGPARSWTVGVVTCPPTTCAGLISAGAVGYYPCISPGTIRVYGVQ